MIASLTRCTSPGPSRGRTTPISARSQKFSVWVDRQWSNKLECYVAQARRVVMAYGLAGAHREELKDKQLLSLRTELRSYRLNGSGINKIVRSTSATPWSIKRSNVRVQTCNRCSDSACCRLVVDQPVVAQAAISDPGAYAFYHPGADC